MRSATEILQGKEPVFRTQTPTMQTAQALTEKVNANMPPALSDGNAAPASPSAGIRQTQTVMQKEQTGGATTKSVGQSGNVPGIAGVRKMAENLNLRMPQTNAFEDKRVYSLPQEQRFNHQQEKPSAGTQPEQTEQPRQMGYAELFKAMQEDNIETPEQRKARERRERNEAIIRSVGDGISALSDLYFATKNGAKGFVMRDPKNSLTARFNERKKRLDAERKEREKLYLAGYQRAQALDEEARKNNMTLAETVRYHNMMAADRERGRDQGDRKLDQGDRRLDLTEKRITNDKEYKDAYLEIRRQEKDGKLTHWEAQDAVAAARSKISAAKGGGNKGLQGYWYRYYQAYETPEGKRKLDALARNLPAGGKVDNRTIKWIMDKYDGGGTTSPSRTQPHPKPSAKKTPQKKTHKPSGPRRENSGLAGVTNRR
nr:MAG TPA_asm: hypothetical protein [Caudoviricetes sp.]